MKQDEPDGDLEFILIIRLGGKSVSYRKWRRVCKAYKNPISKSNVGHMSFENGGKACEARVISTTKSGMVKHMDWGFLEKAQL